MHNHVGTSSWSGSWRLLYRLPLLLLHLLVGLPLTVLSFAPPARALRIGQRRLNEHMQCWWAAVVCRIFGVRTRVRGEFRSGPQLVAANHIAWIDIQVLHRLSPLSFVAKAEIEAWPLAGWLARLGDTVFHHRGSHDSARDVTMEMARRLQMGQKVAIFAEGGILPGPGVKRFHARLFAPAIDCAVPVQPVMLRYLRGGRSYPEITFLPGESQLANIFRLLRQQPCLAEVAILPPLDTRGRQRRELASEAEAAVRSAFEGEPGA